jgi:hypothetical protein
MKKDLSYIGIASEKYGFTMHSKEVTLVVVRTKYIDKAVN